MLRPECVPEICPNCQHPQTKHVRIAPGELGCTAAKGKNQHSNTAPGCTCGWPSSTNHAPRPAHLLQNAKERGTP